MASHNSYHRRARNFQSVRCLQDLANALKIPSSKIALQSLHPQYHVFTLFKGNGKKRLIEDPAPLLKKILRQLNECIQAQYYTLRPDAVHGFCVSNDEEEDRNIRSNARRHMGNPWLLNIDFRDFFHTILTDRVAAIWQQHFPKMNEELVNTLTQLTCYNHRLPMGAPTSPALSNFAALALDAELETFCSNSGMVYTRFADDCSFSSHQKIDATTIGIIRSAVKGHRFLINEDKVKLFTPKDTKVVTGIVVGEDALSLPEKYLYKLDEEITRYTHTRLVEQRFQTGMSLKKLKLFEQELRGKLSFANMVMGDHEEVIQLQARFEEAIHPPEDFESDNWLDIPYTFF